MAKINVQKHKIIVPVIILIACALLSPNVMAEKKKEKTRQIKIFCATRINYAATTGREYCMKRCSKYNINIQDYMDDGWRVVTSSPHEEIIVNFSESHFGAEWGRDAGDSYLGCKCEGTEYIVEK